MACSGRGTGVGGRSGQCHMPQAGSTKQETPKQKMSNGKPPKRETLNGNHQIGNATLHGERRRDAGWRPAVPASHAGRAVGGHMACSGRGAGDQGNSTSRDQAAMVAAREVR